MRDDAIVNGFNTIEVFVTRIRKKLGAEVITTIRGLGYSLDDPADQPRA